jgi:tetratricopeptide (TPR) repeat protein
MDISLRIKSLLSEAELYRTQGLFPEAKDKYHAASAMIHKIDKLKNKENLLKAISSKIQSLEKKTAKVETGPASPELSEKGQNLIKNLFGENDLQKAVALARFGQFERAITELTALLKDDASGWMQEKTFSDARSQLPPLTMPSINTINGFPEIFFPSASWNPSGAIFNPF